MYLYFRITLPPHNREYAEAMTAKLFVTTLPLNFSSRYGDSQFAFLTGKCIYMDNYLNEADIQQPTHSERQSALFSKCWQDCAEVILVQCNLETMQL